MTRQFSVIGRIGHGVFGIVYLIQQNDGKKCALKIIDTRSPKYRAQNVKNEIMAMKSLNHGSICKLIDHWEEDNKVHMMIELAEGEDLICRMESRSFAPLDEPIVRRIFISLIDAMQHCKEKGVAHRDIKLDNIMVSDDFEKVKLIDFGLSRLEHPKESTGSAGSVEYSAPEIFKPTSYNAFKADIWSAGIVLYALLFGQFPFSKNRLATYQAGQRSALKLDGIWPSTSVSKDAKDLLKKMLKPNPAKRAGLKSIKKHKWMQARASDRRSFSAA